MEHIRILIADDHPLFRYGIRALLSTEAIMELVGEATSGEEAIERAATLQPDIVLMDLNMPGINGIEATRRILAASPHIAILMLTMFDDEDSIFKAMQVGARGYLLKGAEPEETMHAIQIVSNGGAVFSPGIAQRIMNHFQAPQQRHIASPLFPELTEREREILTLMARGFTNLAIAGKLSLTHKTVRNYVSNILSKLQVADRVEAILRARDVGLG